MDFWMQFPGREELLDWYEKNGKGTIFSVNAHLHTPYSFSAFRDIPQALDMGVAENVAVMGINDFYSTDGYAECRDAIDRAQALLGSEPKGLASITE